MEACKIRLLKNKFTDNLQAKARIKRFAYFESLIRTIDRPLSILDLGGTLDFWEKMGFVDKKDITIVLLNLVTSDFNYRNFVSIKGDARNLKRFKNTEFDVVFSNSVIEHVGNFNDQMSMANGIRRVSKRYFIQTPYFWFPIEPHYRTIYFQLYPTWLKIFRLKYFSKMGRFPRLDSKDQAIKEAHKIKLLTLKDLRILFPEANIYKERFFGLTKSIVAYNGFY